MNDLQIASTAPPTLLASGLLPPQPGTVTPKSILPEPQLVSDSDDALAGLLTLESRSRNASVNRAIQDINSLRQQQSAEWEKQKAALFEAARAQEDSGFWGSLGKICGVVGEVAAVVTSVAVAVGTGGAGLPFVLAVAGACLSTAAIAQGELDVLQKLGVDAETSGWIEFGLAVGGVVCTAGAAWTSGTESATQFQKIAGTAEKVSTVAAGGATIVGGIATKKKYDSDARAEDRFADAASARAEQSRLDQMLIRVLDDLEESEKSYRQTVGAAKGAMDIQDNTLLVSIRRN